MPAFSQPVFDMQRVFRVVLDAMSRPARLCRLPVFPQSVPDGLSPVLADLALTLCDGESPLWLSPGLRKDGTTTWLRFHCGCPIVEEADKAAFALVADVAELPPLSAFAQGVPAYPDRSATVLLAGLAFDAGTRFRGSGPRHLRGTYLHLHVARRFCGTVAREHVGLSARRGHAVVRRRRRGRSAAHHAP